MSACSAHCHLQAAFCGRGIWAAWQRSSFLTVPAAAAAAASFPFRCLLVTPLSACCPHGTSTSAQQHTTFSIGVTSAWMKPPQEEAQSTAMFMVITMYHARYMVTSPCAYVMTTNTVLLEAVHLMFC